jgi:K+-transporting ATPase KdpF subunit
VTVTTDTVVALLVSIALVAYLITAMLRPEKF